MSIHSEEIRDYVMDCLTTRARLAETEARMFRAMFHAERTRRIDREAALYEAIDELREMVYAADTHARDSARKVFDTMSYGGPV